MLQIMFQVRQSIVSKALRTDPSHIATFTKPAPVLAVDRTVGHEDGSAHAQGPRLAFGRDAAIDPARRVCTIGLLPGCIIHRTLSTAPLGHTPEVQVDERCPSEGPARQKRNPRSAVAGRTGKSHARHLAHQQRVGQAIGDGGERSGCRYQIPRSSPRPPAACWTGHR